MQDYCLNHLEGTWWFDMHFCPITHFARLIKHVFCLLFIILFPYILHIILKSFTTIGHIQSCFHSYRMNGKDKCFFLHCLDKYILFYLYIWLFISMFILSYCNLAFEKTLLLRLTLSHLNIYHLSILAVTGAFKTYRHTNVQFGRYTI